MIRYPVVLEPDDNGTVMVTFPDLPEAQTFGEDADDALEHASDALPTIIDGYIKARRPLPTPSDTFAHAAELSPLMSTKVELYNAMQTQGVSKSLLGRRLNWHPPQVDRLLNLTHSSQVDQLDAAARALGGALSMHIEGLPPRARVVLEGKRRDLSIAAAVTSGRSTKLPKSTKRLSNGGKRKSLAKNVQMRNGLRFFNGPSTSR